MDDPEASFWNQCKMTMSQLRTGAARQEAEAAYRRARAPPVLPVAIVCSEEPLGYSCSHDGLLTSSHPYHGCWIFSLYVSLCWFRHPSQLGTFLRTQNVSLLPFNRSPPPSLPTISIAHISMNLDTATRALLTLVCAQNQLENINANCRSVISSTGRPPCTNLRYAVELFTCGIRLPNQRGYVCSLKRRCLTPFSALVRCWCYSPME